MREFGKRCLSLLLAVVLFVGMLPAITPTANAATVGSGEAIVKEAEKYDGWKYETFKEAGKGILWGHWCAWFVSRCINDAGMGEFFGIKGSYWDQVGDFTEYLIENGKGTLYYYKDSKPWKEDASYWDSARYIPKKDLDARSKRIERNAESFEPKAGDLILFNGKSTYPAGANTHIGIVKGMDSSKTKVFYVDGNTHGNGEGSTYWTSSEVDFENYEYISALRIGGYIRPNYCKHSKGYDDYGKCKDCKEEGSWTYYPEFLTVQPGIHTASVDVVMKKKPYEKASDVKTVPTGKEIKVLGAVLNAKGQVWQQCSYGGSNGYVYYPLTFKSGLPSEITFKGLKTPGKLSVGSSWPVTGSITSTYAIKEVVGKVMTSDGTVKDTAKAIPASGATTFNIGGSPVDNNLEFGKLKTGYYYYTITATDVKGESKTWTSESFQVGSPTQGTCAKPKITEASVAGGKQITITTTTSGATINWSYGSKSGSGKSPVTLTLTGSATVKATATKSGMKKSGEAKSSITVSQCAVPTIEVGNLTSAGRQVAIRSQDSVELYYSINGQSFQKYTSSLYVTATSNIRAYAVKKGFVNSETATQIVTLTEPATPKVRLVSTAQNIASGRPITVMWDKDSNVTSYKVDVYYEDEVVETKYRTTTSHTFATSAQGNYKVLVTASNVVGSSTAGESPVVTAHAPSIVQFYHEDGTLLSEQQVEYGESAVAPEAVPSKEGHTFVGWDNNLSNITQDTTIWAKFRINTYTVRFYACNGTELLGTQQITYGGSINSAEMEQRLSLDTGYTFVGWHIRDAASKSRMDLDFIDCDMSLVATQQWEIRDLPIVVSITDAKRNAECTGYDVNLALTCAPAGVIGGDTQKAKVIVTLKTVDYQTLAVAVETVNLTEETQNLSRSIFVSYDGSYLADQVQVSVLGVDGNDRTGGQLAKTVYATPKVGKNWSAWSTVAPPAGTEYETKTQYRYQDSSRATTTRENKSTTAPTVSGWTNLPGLRTSRWDSWSAWSDSSVTSYSDRQIETQQVQTAAAYKMYQYGRWTNGSYGCYCKVAGKKFYGGSWKQEHTDWTKTRYKKIDEYCCGGYTSDDGHINTINDDDYTWYAYSKNGDDNNKTRYYWEKTKTVPATYKTQYRYRDTIYTHHYEKWTTGNWSAWSDTVYTPHNATNSKRAVETRTLYRYVTNDTSVTGLDNQTKLYDFEGMLTGENVGDYSGKLGTVLVYKQVNSDPTEPQMEAIGQIEIGVGNGYDFALRPKEEPTVATGDFIVALALQGSSNVVNIGKISAPAEEFKVTFSDHDGTVLEEQIVSEGETAIAPELPDREGYRFICWNNDLTCVERDMTVFPIYVAEEYSVVFVDHENETVELKTDYVYGDALLTPDTPSCEGMTFVGWQITYNSTGETEMLEIVSVASEETEGAGIDVTDDMIVTAVWEPIEYTVTFYNHDGSVLQEQAVAHGCAATLPDAITVPEGMVFLGWSTDVRWWNVTEDLSVMPIVVYEETTSAPASDEFKYMGLMEDIELVSEDGAVIYYTLDGSNPEPGQEGTYVYSEPIHVETDTQIRAMAIKENKNISEIVEVSFWYMDGMEDYPVDDTLLVGNYNIQVEPGSTVQLQLNIENNPGLVAYMFFVDANTNVFSIPTNVETGETTCTAGTICSNGALLVADYEEDLGWPVLWYGTEAAEGNGNLCNITLQVSEDAEAGTYPITVRYSPANTFDEEYITQEIPGLSAGFSGASEFKMGDVDGDGMVTNKDVVLTARWIIGAVKIAEERQFLIDVNNDGSKTMADVLHMARYVVGLEHVLGGLG